MLLKSGKVFFSFEMVLSSFMRKGFNIMGECLGHLSGSEKGQQEDLILKRGQLRGCTKEGYHFVSEGFESYSVQIDKTFSPRSFFSSSSSVSDLAFQRRQNSIKTSKSGVYCRE